MDTLILNSAYMPIDRKSWIDAIGDLITGRAEVVETYDAVIRSGKMIGDVPLNLIPLTTEEDGVWLVPSIIRFVTKAVFISRPVKFNRHNVWLRDKGRCQFCSTKLSMAEFTFDHVLPQSRGGGTNWLNIVCACLPCNHKKANRTPAEAGMRLRREPLHPKYLPGEVSPTLKWQEGMPESWKDFLSSVSYWHSKLD